MRFANTELIMTVKEAADHEAWLRTRNMGLGGSDAGVILGYNKYKTPFQLWLEKTGQAEPPDLSDNQAVYWGTKNEANIADWFSEQTGKKVERCGTLRSLAHPFMLANVDRVVVGENAGLEIKTAGVRQYKYWQDDEIPDSYYCQCLHYMAVTGADRWYIAVLIGGNDAKVKTIERNDDDIKALIQAENDFWHLIQTKKAPPIDGSESCASALQGMYPGVKDTTINLPNEALQLINDINLDTLTIKKLKENQQLKKNQLMDLMGNNEVGIVGDHKVTWKASKGRETVSLSKIKKSASDIYSMLRDRNLITVSKPSRVLKIR
jgi:putative phage-type endonuclease